MGAAGSKLIWSPRSNLVLYAQTTNIPVALQRGIEVSLGVDWNPSGSDHIFDELRTAAEVNEEEFNGAIPDTDWIKMITVTPPEHPAHRQIHGAGTGSVQGVLEGLTGEQQVGGSRAHMVQEEADDTLSSPWRTSEILGEGKDREFCCPRRVIRRYPMRPWSSAEYTS